LRSRETRRSAGLARGRSAEVLGDLVDGREDLLVVAGHLRQLAGAGQEPAAREDLDQRLAGIGEMLGRTERIDRGVGGVLEALHEGVAGVVRHLPGAEHLRARGEELRVLDRLAHDRVADRVAVGIDEAADQGGEAEERCESYARNSRFAQSRIA
jgi:hypothetical protein